MSGLDPLVCVPGFAAAGAPRVYTGSRGAEHTLGSGDLAKVPSPFQTSISSTGKWE